LKRSRIAFTICMGFALCTPLFSTFVAEHGQALIPNAFAAESTRSTLQHRSSDIFPIPIIPSVLNQKVVQGIPSTDSPRTDWPPILSQAAVVMDANTGTIIYQKNALVRHYPASITKILTAILAVQHGHLSDVLTATKDSTIQPADKLYMIPGEQAPLENILYALLLDSANDAAVMIADKYGGSVSGFSEMMNAEARRLGAVHSHFVNPNGLPDDNHYTTAYDMALIARAAMQYPEIRKIVDTKIYHWQGAKWSSDLPNLNRMLFYYPGSIGMKTGYTSVAHETLVEVAKRGNQTFIAVLLDTPTDYEIRHDCSQLLDFSFAHYQTQTLMSAGMPVSTWKSPSGQTTRLVTGASVLATVPVSESISGIHEIAIDHAKSKSSEPKGAVVGDLLWSHQGLTVKTPVILKSAWTVPKPLVTHQSLFRWVLSGAVLLSLVSIFRLLRRD
jgi:serine-type D-Ala-D-Ala carboxypeptidase (penicillin-binding protein 5/6)